MATPTRYPVGYQPPTRRPPTDWPSAQQNDSLVGEVYRLVHAGSPRPAPGLLTDRCAEANSLLALPSIR